MGVCSILLVVVVVVVPAAACVTSASNDNLKGNVHPMFCDIDGCPKAVFSVSASYGKLRMPSSVICDCCYFLITDCGS